MSAGPGPKPCPGPTQQEINLTQLLEKEIEENGLNEDCSVQHQLAEQLRQLREKRHVYANMSLGFVERQHQMAGAVI